ncbi:hypothetical protein RF11_12443 [Thelohanellus kitauei]|uniref:Uncharacterized protein n=1 Tax=Thelohanellus kitauei TaxID=669202 RepID=A0A0C2J1P5_THEKT|nr:hypothetical protein RF11_12443 [Thelohanellus kitauei]
MSPNNPAIDKIDVQYKLKEVKSCYGIKYHSFMFLRLNDGLGYHTLLFVTFSIDVGGKQVIDTYHLNFKRFGSSHIISGLEMVVSMSIAIAKGLDDLEDLGKSLITTVDRINKLRESQVYSIQFVKYLKGSQIYFVPNRDQTYQDIPRYAEIQIYLLDKRGRVISNPEAIKDIIEIKAVNRNAIQNSQVPFYTTEYMKKYDLIIVITEPDTQKQWRAIYTFSDGTLIPKERSQGNSDFFGIIPSFVDAKTDFRKDPYNFWRHLRECLSAKSVGRWNSVYFQKAVIIEKYWNDLLVKQQALCVLESRKDGIEYLGMFLQVPCSTSEILQCKTKVKNKTQTLMSK